MSKRRKPVEQDISDVFGIGCLAFLMVGILAIMISFAFF